MNQIIENTTQKIIYTTITKKLHYKQITIDKHFAHNYYTGEIYPLHIVEYLSVYMDNSSITDCRFIEEYQITANKHTLKEDAQRITFNLYKENEEKVENNQLIFDKTIILYHISDIEELQHSIINNTFENETYLSIQEFIDSYLTKENIIMYVQTHYNIPFYYPTKDTIIIPDITNWREKIHVQFHEIAHSTASATRLNRSKHNLTKDIEEVIAECSAIYLDAIFNNVDEVLFDNSIAYIQTWLSKNNLIFSALVTALSYAQSVVNYIISNGNYQQYLTRNANNVVRLAKNNQIRNKHLSN